MHHHEYDDQREYARLSIASLISGLSRSGIYRAAAEGKITLRKAGKSTLVEMRSLRLYVEGLPTYRPRISGVASAHAAA